MVLTHLPVAFRLPVQAALTLPTGRRLGPGCGPETFCEDAPTIPLRHRRKLNTGWCGCGVFGLGWEFG